MKNILLFILFLISLSASAQIKNEAIITPQFLMSHEIRINPKDTAMMHEKDLILSPVFLTLDPSYKIYSKEERDSIVAMVKKYKEVIKKY